MTQRADLWQKSELSLVISKHQTIPRLRSTGRSISRAPPRSGGAQPSAWRLSPSPGPVSAIVDMWFLLAGSARCTHRLVHQAPSVPRLRAVQAEVAHERSLHEQQIHRIRRDRLKWAEKALEGVVPDRQISESNASQEEILHGRELSGELLLLVTAPPPTPTADHNYAASTTMPGSPRSPSTPNTTTSPPSQSAPNSSRPSTEVPAPSPGPRQPPAKRQAAHHR
jgi:hypothetical protein